MRSSMRGGASRPLQGNHRGKEAKAHKRSVYGPNYIEEEETIRNDYSRHYIVAGSRPQNHIQNPFVTSRFAEYPRLRRLLDAKEEAVVSQAHPPTYLQADLRATHSDFDLQSLLPCRFDVILLDPPLKEYADRHPDRFPEDSPGTKGGGPPAEERPWWSWEELEALPIPAIAANPGFLLIWCGNGQGPSLEQGRQLLTKWGYRKCEDLVWVKTNRGDSKDAGDKARRDEETEPPTSAVLTPTKEHCLMGIRGTVRRSTDGHFVHCNVDTDVIIAEVDNEDPIAKPQELYDLIENFCLGSRRLELFGSQRSLRRGWLTIGLEVAPAENATTNHSPKEIPVPFDKEAYAAHFYDPVDGRVNYLVQTTAEIESLRPRSPPPRTGAGTPTNVQGQLPRGLGTPSGGSMLSLASGSGRNTVSHPSGGLGRGPGNAYQPGMRLSGVRELGPGASPSHRQSPPLHPPPPQGRQQQQPFAILPPRLQSPMIGVTTGGMPYSLPMFQSPQPAMMPFMGQGGGAGWMTPQTTPMSPQMAAMSPIISPPMAGGEWGMLAQQMGGLSLGQVVGTGGGMYGGDPTYGAMMAMQQHQPQSTQFFQPQQQHGYPTMQQPYFYQQQQYPQQPQDAAFWQQWQQQQHQQQQYYEQFPSQHGQYGYHPG